MSDAPGPSEPPATLQIRAKPARLLWYPKEMEKCPNSGNRRIVPGVARVAPGYV